MKLNCRHLSIFLILITCASSVSDSSAGTRCKCPSVAAVGEGNSSCSASESNGQCTVDFNVFAEREDRSIELLRNSNALDGLDHQFFIPDKNSNSNDVLRRAGELGQNSMADTILVYSLVALSAQQNRESFSREVRSITRAIQENSSRISDFFRPPGDLLPLDERPRDEINTENVRGLLAPGCIELRVDDVWVMFKTYWSSLREEPRCGS
jgi:hypothetical protein